LPGLHARAGTIARRANALASRPRWRTIELWYRRSRDSEIDELEKWPPRSLFSGLMSR
jgi:hypothetical protein